MAEIKKPPLVVTYNMHGKEFSREEAIERARRQEEVRVFCRQAGRLFSVDVRPEGIISIRMVITTSGWGHLEYPGEAEALSAVYAAAGELLAEWEKAQDEAREARIRERR